MTVEVLARATQISDAFGELVREVARSVVLVRGSMGSSGSGVIWDRPGLVITNHHVAFGQLQKVSTPQKDYVKEGFYAKNTLASGSAWDIAFSRDPEQRFIYMADGINDRVRIILRETMREITSFGDGGRQAGQFYGVHSVATDSKGNLYTTETWEGKRLQNFVFKGVGQVIAGYQGVLWPKR